MVGPNQATSVDDAIRAVTIDAARQIGQGDRLGSLEKDKEADFTIFESDPYKVSPMRSPTLKSAIRGWRGSGSSRHDATALRLKHLSHGSSRRHLALSEAGTIWH